MHAVAVKPQPNTYESESGLQFAYDHFSVSVNAKQFANFAPYQVGDMVWVREAFRIVNDLPDPDPFVVRYEAGGERRSVPSAHQGDAGDIDYRAGEELQPSSRMPRWASRLTLRVTDVSVERDEGGQWTWMVAFERVGDTKIEGGRGFDREGGTE
jgi:hypothetical protein